MQVPKFKYEIQNSPAFNLIMYYFKVRCILYGMYIS